MAINQNSIWNLKYILCITFVFFLFSFAPVAGMTEHFQKSASQQYHADYITGGSISGVAPTEILLFNDIGTTHSINSITLQIDNYNWYGGASSEWKDVEYRLNSPTGTLLATGTYGYNNGSDYVFVIATFDKPNLFSDYTGAQKVYIVGGPFIHFGSTPTWTTYRTYNGANIDVTTKTTVYLGGYLGPTYFASVGDTGHDSNSELDIYLSYDFRNSYTYYNDGLLNKLEVERTDNQSIWTVERGGNTIFGDHVLNSTDFPVYDNDLDNNTWDIMCNDSYGNTYTDTIDMAYTPPQAEDTILWGADSYVVDDTGSYSWVLSDSNWDTIWYSKKASIYRDETLVHEVSLSNQTGTGYYTFEEESTFTVKLRHTSALLPHVTIDTDTVNVLPVGDSYIHVNSTIGVGEDFNISFSYGFTPYLQYAEVNGIKAKYYDEDSNQWLYEKIWGISDLFPITANTIYQVSGTHTISFEGSYIFELYDFQRGIVATTPVITAVASSNVPTMNISNSYLNITKTNYVMGEIMDGFYGIDNTNYTYNNYLVVYNYQYDTTSMDFPLTEQTSGFYGTLVQTDIHGDWLYEGEIPVIPGSNKISIYAENSTTRFEVVHVNFTVSVYDEDGYGLQLSTYDACINEEVLISVISPTDANLTIFSPSGMPIKTYTLNGSTTIKYWFPTSGMYSLELYKSGEGISRATVTIYISDCADDGIIEPPSGEMDDMYINMFNAMTVPAFWGMIIFIGFIGGLAIKRDKNGDALVSGNGLAFIAFGLLNLLSIIGLFAPYTFYIIVSTWIFAGMFFGVGRYLARGEG